MSAFQETTGGAAVDEHPGLPGIADPRSRAQDRTLTHWYWPTLFLFVCFASVLVLFRHTLLSMVNTWYGSRTYSHCFLIFPIFLYLVWVRRGDVARLKPAPDYWGLPLLGGLASVWVLANLAEVRIAQEFAVVAILIVLVWTLLGTAVVRALAFPVLFLFFAVPFGASLIKPLQDLTTWIVVHALTISNVPAVLENHTLSLPSGAWTVAEACSGIRFLLSSVVLGTVFASIAYRSRKRQLLFMCASVVVPIIANGLRAYGIVLLAYLTDNRVAAGVDHIVYGTLFYLFVQLVLILVGLRWRETRGADDPITPDSARLLDASPKENGSPGMAAFVVSAASLVLISPAPFVAAHLWSRATATSGWAEPPVIVSAPWQVAASSDMSWAPELRGSDKEFSQSYTYQRDRIDLHWVFYSGRHGTDLVGSYNLVADPKLWALAADSFGSTTVDGRPVSVHRSLIESGSVSRSVWTWYWVSGEYTASSPRVRFLQAKARLLGKPATVAVISVGTENQADASQAERVFGEFLRHASFLVTGASPPSRESPTRGSDDLGLCRRSEKMGA